MSTGSAAFVLMDPAGRVVSADDGFCELVGRPLAEVIGATPPYPWWPEDEVPWFLAQLGPRQRSAPRRRRFEGEWQRPDGARVPVTGTVSRLASSDGSAPLVVQSVRAATTAELNSEPTRVARPELEGWLRRLFRANVVGIIAGENDEVIEANDAFLHMLGLTREGSERQGLNWAQLTPSEWLDTDARAGEAMVRQGISPAVEKEYFHTDGSRIRVRIIGVALSDRPFRWFSVVENRTAEQRYADAIREAIVPAVLPQVPGIEVHAQHYASDGFTGDFYDLFPLPGGGDWNLVVGDVCGHGHHAATLATLARHALHGAALADPRPARALTHLNRLLLEDDADSAYCTVVSARLRRRRSTLYVRIARAGHPYPLLIRSSGRVERIAPEGLPLGLLPSPRLREEHVLLDPGDVLVLYTDGLTDTPAGEPSLDEQEIADVLGTVVGAGPRAVLDALVDHLHDRLSRPLSDDIALITVGI